MENSKNKSSENVEIASQDEAAQFDHTQLDELLSSRLRLAVMSVLLGCEKADFTFIRDQVRASDGNLAVHSQKLSDAGYITIEKQFVGKKPLTTYAITDKGRAALLAYAERLKAMLDG